MAHAQSVSHPPSVLLPAVRVTQPCYPGSDTSHRRADAVVVVFAHAAMALSTGASVSPNSLSECAAAGVERALSTASGDSRIVLARDSYTFLHLPMVAGIVLLALGLKKALTYTMVPWWHPTTRDRTIRSTRRTSSYSPPDRNQPTSSMWPVRAWGQWPNAGIPARRPDASCENY